MLEHNRIQSLNDYFVELNSRRGRGVFFYRINGYSEEIEQFILKYYDITRRTGVIIEGKIPNPDEKNLSYYGEIMGMDFRMNMGFITSSLKKWLPRMNDRQRDYVAASIYDSLELMRKDGKTEYMMRNAYIKFMCWLYYKFERIVNRLGENELPKILYEGDISNYELMLISILCKAGCDVVLLQYHGDQGYRKLDPGSVFSDPLEISGLKPFPEGFSLKKVQEAIQNEFNRDRLYGTRPSLMNCTNAWIKGAGLDDFRESPSARGTDPGLFYNCYYRINGVEDKPTYVNELYRFHLDLKGAGRRIVVVNEEIPKPLPDEIAAVRRSNYTKQDQMILDLAANIQYSANIELQRLMNKAFVDTVLAEAKSDGGNLNKLTNKAVYLLCWLKRYQGQLFSNWKMPDISCFVYMGGCKNENEAMFIRFLARLPIDVLILCPNLSTKCCLTDNLLYEINYPSSLAVNKYPEENSQVRVGTSAFHAERELDSLIYQDSGLYRNQQYAKANSITLQTMYEEIRILWDQELKYRPSFSTVDGVVNVPVIFAKVSGVKDGALPKYWMSIKELLTEDTIFVKNAPYIESTKPNPMKMYAAEFYKNGKLRRQRIKNHPSYPYGFLREEMQDLILDKLQLLIEQRLIRGTFENGTEYNIVAVILNLEKDIIRRIQKFDLTKKNPKLVYVNTMETMISLEDAILAAFLNLIGFDILFFVPTGYQILEKHFNKSIMEEHQIGEYVYDLQIPDMNRLSMNSARTRWRDIINKRGNRNGT